MSATEPGGRLAGVPTCGQLDVGAVQQLAARARTASSRRRRRPRPATSAISTLSRSAESPNRAGRSRRDDLGRRRRRPRRSSSLVLAVVDRGRAGPAGRRNTAPRPSQNGAAGSRHGSRAASSFHHGDSGSAPDGSIRVPGGGVEPVLRPPAGAERAGRSRTGRSGRAVRAARCAHRAAGANGPGAGRTAERARAPPATRWAAAACTARGAARGSNGSLSPGGRRYASSGSPAARRAGVEPSCVRHGARCRRDTFAPTLQHGCHFESASSRCAARRAARVSVETDRLSRRTAAGSRLALARWLAGWPAGAFGLEATVGRGRSPASAPSTATDATGEHHRAGRDAERRRPRRGTNAAAARRSWRTSACRRRRRAVGDAADRGGDRDLAQPVEQAGRQRRAPARRAAPRRPRAARATASAHSAHSALWLARPLPCVAEQHVVGEGRDRLVGQVLHHA